MAQTDFFCPHCGMFVVLQPSHTTTKTTANFGSCEEKPWKLTHRSYPSKLPSKESKNLRTDVIPQQSKIKVPAVRDQPSRKLDLERKLMKRVVAKIKDKARSDMFPLVSTHEVQFRMFPLSVHEANWLPVTLASIHISLIEKTNSTGFSERLLRVALHRETASTNKDYCQGMRFIHHSKSLQTVGILTNVQAKLLVRDRYADFDLNKVIPLHFSHFSITKFRLISRITHMYCNYTIRWGPLQKELNISRDIFLA